ncbi:unnamed protein product [Acanthosepion pharaonis]|uniref:Uncharacterized protein n=1 Tax=Acanthosepion pharaonis TaxID=158019 RepID=A0A812D2C0_ACAPH|nr:unnamed protein product [Sepia pharaonis]
MIFGQFSVTFSKYLFSLSGPCSAFLPFISSLLVGLTLLRSPLSFVPHAKFFSVYKHLTFHVIAAFHAHRFLIRDACEHLIGSPVDHPLWYLAVEVSAQRHCHVLLIVCSHSLSILTSSTLHPLLTYQIWDPLLRQVHRPRLLGNRIEFSTILGKAGEASLFALFPSSSGPSFLSWASLMKPLMTSIAVPSSAYSAAFL